MSDFPEKDNISNEEPEVQTPENGDDGFSTVFSTIFS